MKRRDLLKMFGVAPAVILTHKLLMPVKSMAGNTEILTWHEWIAQLRMNTEQAMFYGSEVDAEQFKGLAGRYN